MKLYVGICLSRSTVVVYRSLRSGALPTPDPAELRNSGVLSTSTRDTYTTRLVKPVPIVLEDVYDTKLTNLESTTLT